MKVEKAIEIVRKLLAVVNDKGASEGESMTAALKAQEIMAKYNINLADVEDESESDSEEIVDFGVDVGKGNKWKYQLAMVIANNFCCKTYGCGSQMIFFYGYKKHAEVAKEVFTFLYNTGNKLADRYYAELYNRGESTKGVKNTFLLGYLKGIKSVLEKQCVALVLVVPQEVNKAFDEKMIGSRHKRTTMTSSGDRRAFDRGVSEGRSVANARSIEG